MYELDRNAHSRCNRGLKGRNEKITIKHNDAGYGIQSDNRRDDNVFIGHTERGAEEKIL